MPDSNSELLRYEVFHFQGGYGGRIFEDGRYELYDNQAPGAEPAWEAFDPFTSEQMRELDAMVDSITNSSLPERIQSADPIPPDSAHATFTLRGKRYAISNYTSAAPAEFIELIDRIAQLRKALK
jgi:hypothetical protein